MKNNEKTMMSQQYKCRKCGMLFVDGELDLYDTLFPEQWTWSKADMDNFIEKFKIAIGHEPLSTQNPDLFSTHRCTDNNTGVADLIGFVNRKVFVKHGRGWMEKKKK